jgi:hypothetical protein
MTGTGPMIGAPEELDGLPSRKLLRAVRPWNVRTHSAAYSSKRIRDCSRYSPRATSGVTEDLRRRASASVEAECLQRMPAGSVKVTT